MCALLFAGLAAGLWGTYRQAFPSKGLYRVTAVFVTRWGDTMILVKHDAVPGLMEEMSAMSFIVESKALLDGAGLAPGDRVRLTVRSLPDKLLVVEIKKLG